MNTSSSTLSSVTSVYDRLRRAAIHTRHATRDSALRISVMFKHLHTLLPCTCPPRLASLNRTTRFHTVCIKAAISACKAIFSRSQQPRGLKLRSTAARLLRSWVRIPLRAWKFVCCECCVLSGRGFCDGLITRPGESYRMWRVFVCDQETSYARRLKPDRGLQNTNPQWVVAPVEKKIHYSAGRS